MLAACLVFLTLTGCQTPETVDVTQPLPDNLTTSELFLTTRESWETCLAAFYRDDWAKMNDHVARLTELSGRWKAEKAPESIAAEFNAATAGFETSVLELKTAVEAKDVNRVTEAMRRLGKRIEAFEALNRQTSN